MTNKLPIRTEKCPIVDALIEIRFETSLFPNAVFGLIYDAIRGDYPGTVEKLPILQLPDQLREQDPGLKFKPHYKIENTEFILQIGPDVLTISTKMPYPGWEKFESHVFYILGKIIEKKIISRVIRLGHRYINFFPGNIFSNLNIEFSMCKGDYKPLGTIIYTETKDGEFVNTLQLSNNATSEKDKKITLGTVIDIDTYRVFDDSSFINSHNDNINIAHITGKKLFFSLLKDDLLNSLNPIYEDGK